MVINIHMQLAPARNESALDRKGRMAGAPFERLETEVIDLFVQIFAAPSASHDRWGKFTACSLSPPGALAMDELIHRLELSKGSASQGLKFLARPGRGQNGVCARRPRVQYEAVAELRNLATRFLQGQVVPHLDSGLERLDRILTW